MHAFVIRVWNEGAGAGKPKVWRGYIEHVNHNARLYFSDLNGVARFIQRQIVDFSPPPSNLGWRQRLMKVFHGLANGPKERTP